MVRHGHGISVEVVGSMLEMADMAWHALEHRRERGVAVHDDHESARLRDENLRLRTILSDNLALLQTIYNSPEVSLDCPPDLHSRLLAAVKNSNFLENLESLHEGSKCIENSGVPITNDIDANQSGTEVAIKVGDAEPSWWVWVVHEITPDCLEEISGIDNENYVIISEENVVDGISNYIARCIIEHPDSKILTPEELQKVVTKAMGVTKDRRKWKDIWEAGKIIYTLSTWGIALAGLYRHRAIVKAAVKGVGASANLVRKAL
ncbi:uncharacterized protein LOC121971706 [Zingiber officinale]|uniref:Uncharacterized protein n=1 Tax=Zingiber officinale TaxID=94328 RepID=A0A8J5LI59_ZINOF|nr:uncharacterized protein LOC121971706 [Zingiber officinale]KAG6516287.1 hypothetical protein ZIOFF_026742 [Zingiber officinale]